MWIVYSLLDVDVAVVNDLVISDIDDDLDLGEMILVLRIMLIA